MFTNCLQIVLDMSLDLKIFLSDILLLFHLNRCWLLMVIVVWNFCIIRISLLPTFRETCCLRLQNLSPLRQRCCTGRLRIRPTGVMTEASAKSVPVAAMINDFTNGPLEEPNLDQRPITVQALFSSCSVRPGVMSERAGFAKTSSIQSTATRLGS